MFMPKTQADCYAAEATLAGGRGTVDFTGADAQSEQRSAPPFCAIDARNGDIRVKWNGNGKVNSTWGGNNLGWVAVCSIAPPSPPLPPPSPPRRTETMSILGAVGGIVILVVGVVIICKKKKKGKVAKTSAKSIGQPMVPQTQIPVAETVAAVPMAPTDGPVGSQV